jgi:hypothetical protein
MGVSKDDAANILVKSGPVLINAALTGRRIVKALKTSIKENTGFYVPKKEYIFLKRRHINYNKIHSQGAILTRSTSN